jgi:hypothetical protein
MGIPEVFGTLKILLKAYVAHVLKDILNFVVDRFPIILSWRLFPCHYAFLEQLVPLV